MRSAWVLVPIGKRKTRAARDRGGAWADQPIAGGPRRRGGPVDETSTSSAVARPDVARRIAGGAGVPDGGCARIGSPPAQHDMQWKVAVPGAGSEGTSAPDGIAGGSASGRIEQTTRSSGGNPDAAGAACTNCAQVACQTTARHAIQAAHCRGIRRENIPKLYHAAPGALAASTTAPPPPPPTPTQAPAPTTPPP